ncbi:enoyl-CoA hydratase [Pseudochelatococcus lubricantis]|uniref:3-hydroxyisobutyryl-CoA hydrolase n=1 Tax=Pseudochelatococcus lubricantis TaxID=1538102 RepID=A0ABX0V2R8_9HYPH|nr:enoyl-CoA hydratase/isomerase family protein [Pseudochelatococcus lubricantis]NIJ58120.1 enoyl-CoA hydratase [Pseudochelatococcus lubricantis]
MPLTDNNQADAQARDAHVQIGRSGTLGRIHLNRPKALNSLTLDMVRLIAGALDSFEDDAQVAAVLITGEGERAFCAGGDIRALYDGGPENSAAGRQFWREEYVVNAHIKRYGKPYIAFMDGIVMGGGVGVSAHGSHRIVTDRTRLAMPETGIGFFPDIGGTWLLSRGRADAGTREIGTYLALTGEQINGADAIHAGLADYLVPAARLAALVESLSALPATADAEAVAQAIRMLATAGEPGPVERHETEIDAAFAFDAVEEIVAALVASGSEFARKTLATLQTRSPTSLKLTLKLLRLARNDASLEQTLEREYAAGAAVLAGHEFYEGVRAAIVDKDRNPRWNPPTLDAVSDSGLAQYFVPAPERVFS